MERPQKVRYTGLIRTGQTMMTEQVSLLTALIRMPGWNMTRSYYSYLFVTNWHGLATITEDPDGTGRMRVSYEFVTMDFGYPGGNIKLL